MSVFKIIPPTASEELISLNGRLGAFRYSMPKKLMQNDVVNRNHLNKFVNTFAKSCVLHFASLVGEPILVNARLSVKHKKEFTTFISKKIEKFSNSSYKWYEDEDDNHLSFHLLYNSLPHNVPERYRLVVGSKNERGLNEIFKVVELRTDYKYDEELKKYNDWCEKLKELRAIYNTFDFADKLYISSQID